jgi:2-polyprenyl-6-methoxyphenol hydroxylase-like FAD-dependent oxidoreductase
MVQRVLIAGGGIAGMAAAWWLKRDGAEVTIVERAREFQPLGHYITLKSHGVKTVEAMGLREACRARELSLCELRAHTRQGRLLRRVDASLLARDIEGAIFFRRADLHAALYDAVRADTEVRFGQELGAVRSLADGVEVELASGTERFDLVIGADGVHSKLRRESFGDAGWRPMGGRYIALTVDYEHRLPPGVVSVFFGRGQAVALLPPTAASLSAIVYHGDGGAQPASRDPSALRAFLRDAYAQFAPEVRRTFAALDERSYVYSDDIAMVRAPAIARGRVALLGDAAHCPTFMSGMGSSLALQGARALSVALRAHPDDVPAALAAYTRAITPIARGYQASAGKSRHAFLNRNPFVAGARDALLRWTPSWLFSRSAQGFYHVAQSTPSCGPAASSRAIADTPARRERPRLSPP